MNYHKEGITICKRPYGETMLLSDKDERDPATNINQSESRFTSRDKTANQSQSFLPGDTRLEGLDKIDSIFKLLELLPLALSGELDSDSTVSDPSSLSNFSFCWT